MGLKFRNPSFNINSILEQSKVAEWGTDYIERAAHVKSSLFSHCFCSDLIWKCAKLLWIQFFSYICGGINLYWGSQNYMGGVIFISTLSLFHFLKNSQHPEKWSISFKNFFRNCEYIRSCYLMISSNLLKRSFRKIFVCAYCDRYFVKKCSVSCIF